MALTDKQILEKYKELPQDLQRAMFSVATSNAILKIGQKYSLNVEEDGVLAREVGLVMLGVNRARDLPEHLAKHLHLPREKSWEVAEDINHMIFFQVRESMKKIQGIPTTEALLPEEGRTSLSDSKPVSTAKPPDDKAYWDSLKDKKIEPLVVAPGPAPTPAKESRMVSKPPEPPKQVVVTPEPPKPPSEGVPVLIQKEAPKPSIQRMEEAEKKETTPTPAPAEKRPAPLVIEPGPVETDSLPGIPPITSPEPKKSEPLKLPAPPTIVAEKPAPASPPEVTEPKKDPVPVPPPQETPRPQPVSVTTTPPVPPRPAPGVAAPAVPKPLPAAPSAPSHDGVKYVSHDPYREPIEEL